MEWRNRNQTCCFETCITVVNTYKGELSKGREERKKVIEGLKDEGAFETIIIDYPDLCK